MQDCMDKGFYFSFPLHEAGIDLKFKHYAYRWHYSYAPQMHHQYLIFDGRKVNDGTRVLVVPGSTRVKAQAEAEGLHEVFKAAGAEWRQPGCSMCIAMNGDQLSPGQYAVSTSNRNFEGRQGKGGRTFLASPLTAAAAAVTGKVTDVRELL
mgnify:CR=1 FL=1